MSKKYSRKRSLLKNTNKRKNTNKKSKRFTHIGGYKGYASNNNQSAIINIYGRESCGFTMGALDLVKKLNKKYKFYNLSEENNRDGLEKLKNEYKNNKISEWKTIPIILEGDDFIGGKTDLESYLLTSKSKSKS